MGSMHGFGIEEASINVNSQAQPKKLPLSLPAKSY